MMIRRLVCAALFFASIQVSAAFSDSFDSKISRIMQLDTAKYNIPGASLSISIPGRGIKTYTIGLSDIKKKKAMQSNQLFDIASMTKLFTSVIILKGVEQHKLSLNENLQHVAKRYPKSTIAVFVKRYPVLALVTIRELLNHTSGLPGGMNSAAYVTALHKDPKHFWSQQELIKLALTQKPIFKPSEEGKWNYTNTEYLLLGYIAKAINNKSISESFRALFKEQKLTDTFAPSTKRPYFSKAVLSRLTHFYNAPIQGGQPYISSTTLQVYKQYPSVVLPGETKLKGYDLTSFLLGGRIYSDYPAGGILSTSHDIAKWYANIFSGKVLSQKLTNQLTYKSAVTDASEMKESLDGVKPFVGITTMRYGLAVESQMLPQYHCMVYFHGGREPGYVGTNMYIPKYRVTFVLLTNLANDYVEFPQDEFSADIIHAIIQHEKNTPSKKPHPI